MEKFSLRGSTKDEKVKTYNDREIDAVENHIREYFGDFAKVFHRTARQDIHVDICVIAPTEEKNYYTLVTMGMGAHEMEVPEELDEYKVKRAELTIALPPDWRLDEESLRDSRWNWPVELLQFLVGFPFENGTWLGWAHTIEDDEPYDESIGFRTAMFVSPQGVDVGSRYCLLPDGDEVNFYHVILLYDDELGYKLSKGAKALLDVMDGVGLTFVVDTQRPSMLADDGETQMDDGNYHAWKVREKKLEVEEIAGFNHLAVYLRWCMERGLVGEALEPVAAQVRTEPGSVDLRAYIRDELGGILDTRMLNMEGEAFSKSFYIHSHYYFDRPHYPKCVDDYALEYFGEEAYNSEEFDGEAYLFVPYDEELYAKLSGVIDEAWREWQQTYSGS